jgi:hypothetical protein
VAMSGRFQVLSPITTTTGNQRYSDTRRSASDGFRGRTHLAVVYTELESAFISMLLVEDVVRGGAQFLS